MRTRPTSATLTLLLAMTTGCMKTVSMGDPALKPFESMYSVDRSQYGFSPLPRTGSVSIEGKSLHGDYDAMLHFGGNPDRTIAFHWDGKAYQWLGEQETFAGPQMWDTPDGRFHEEVTITFYREAGDGVFKGLTIGYTGPDVKLMTPRGERSNWSLTLAEVNPLLTKWGFRQ
jgi:hypothetical protein